EDGPAIAWRETRRIRIAPARPGRPSADLLVDKETSLVLRSEMRDFEGRVWLTTVFDSIEYGDPGELRPAAVTEPLRAPEARTATTALPLPAGEPLAGFVRVSSLPTPAGGLREDWSDGLAAYSIIERVVEPGEPASKPGELQRRACS